MPQPNDTNNRETLSQIQKMLTAIAADRATSKKAAGSRRSGTSPLLGEEHLSQIATRRRVLARKKLYR